MPIRAFFHDISQPFLHFICWFGDENCTIHLLIGLLFLIFLMKVYFDRGDRTIFEFSCLHWLQKKVISIMGEAIQFLQSSPDWYDRFQSMLARKHRHFSLLLHILTTFNMLSWLKLFQDSHLCSKTLHHSLQNLGSKAVD